MGLGSVGDQKLAGRIIPYRSSGNSVEICRGFSWLRIEYGNTNGNNSFRFLTILATSSFSKTA
jgi:uncharacterized protein YraI